MKLTITVDNKKIRTKTIKNPTESNIWKTIGETIYNGVKEGKINIPCIMDIHTEDYSSASLKLGKRGQYIENGITYPSLYVTVQHNSISLQPSIYKEKYLTCIHRESNNYKFYWLKPNNLHHEIDACYGRIGSERGEAFGVKDLQEPYPSYLFWIRYYEKLSKGYVDQTDIYLSNDAPEENKKDISELQEEINKVSVDLYNVLKRAARFVVESNLVSSQVTFAQVKSIKELISELENKTTTYEFNDILEKILVLSPRKERQVETLFAHSINDFKKIVLRETNLCTAMEALIPKANNDASTEDIFNALGIKVFAATDKQKEEVYSHLSEDLQKRVVKIYRVINKKQNDRFNEYLKKNKIKKVKQFWHGSTNENWLSIIQNGLKLNPNARITGKMLGHGIYFAPKAQKSIGYTSCNGSYWAKGISNHGFMGLYATAYGRPNIIDTIKQYNQVELLMNGYNCVHAKAEKTFLRNDEIVFYSEDAMTLNYIVEFSA